MHGIWPRLTSTYVLPRQTNAPELNSVPNPYAERYGEDHLAKETGSGRPPSTSWMPSSR